MELPETALTRDWGRWVEVRDEAVGGGMGEGSRRWPLEWDEFSVEACEVWLLPWAAASGRRCPLLLLLVVP